MKMWHPYLESHRAPTWICMTSPSTGREGSYRSLKSKVTASCGHLIYIIILI